MDKPTEKLVETFKQDIMEFRKMIAEFKAMARIEVTPAIRIENLRTHG